MDLLTQFYTTIALMGVAFGLGFYVGERGTSGVKTDIALVKSDIATIKGKLSGTPQTITPVTGSEPTPPGTVTTTPSI